MAKLEAVSFFMVTNTVYLCAALIYSISASASFVQTPSASMMRIVWPSNQKYCAAKAPMFTI